MTDFQTLEDLHHTFTWTPLKKFTYEGAEYHPFGGYFVSNDDPAEPRYIYMNREDEVVVKIVGMNSTLGIFYWVGPSFDVKGRIPTAMKNLVEVIMEERNPLPGAFDFRNYPTIHYMFKNNHPDILEMVDYIKTSKNTKSSLLINISTSFREAE